MDGFEIMSWNHGELSQVLRLVLLISFSVIIKELALSF